MTAAHHENGPSALYRRQACPASMLAERGFPDSSGPDSEEGEFLHFQVVEFYNSFKHPETFVPDVKSRASISDDQAESVFKCVDFLKSFDDQGEEWHLEERLELYESDFSVITFGTPDAFKIIPERGLAILADWKFGRNPVSSPAMNLQFAAYAAMIMQRYGVERVECHLVQPRVYEQPEPFVFTNMKGIVRTIKKIIARCNDVELERVAGDHCKYCRAKNECGAFHSFSTAVSTLNINAVTADNAADIASIITQVRKQCDRATELLKEAVRDAGGMLGNLRLTERAGTRYAYSKELYGCVRDIITADEYMGLVEPRISAVGGLYAANAKELGIAKTKKEAIAQFNELPAIKRKESSEVLKIMRS